MFFEILETFGEYVPYGFLFIGIWFLLWYVVLTQRVDSPKDKDENE